MVVTRKRFASPGVLGFAQVGCVLGKADQPRDVVVFPAIPIVEIWEWKADFALSWLHD
jgi:hypothetical protein